MGRVVSILRRLVMLDFRDRMDRMTNKERRLASSGFGSGPTPWRAMPQATMKVAT